MIHVVTAENAHLYTDQLLEMHRWRRIQCIETNGWRDLVVVEGGEYDDFDDDLAIYLLGLNAAGAIEVGMRCHPSEPRCMLADKYPQLIAEGETPKKGADVWEISRLFTTAAYRDRKSGRGERVFEVYVAAMEIALAAGVTRLVGMLDMALYASVSASPIEFRLTGLPQPYQFGVMAGVEIPLSDALLLRMREAIAVDHAVAYQADPSEVEYAGSVEAVERVWHEGWKAAERRRPVSREEGIAQIEALYRRHDRQLSLRAHRKVAEEVWRERTPQPS